MHRGLSAIAEHLVLHMLRVHPEMKRFARCEESPRGGDVLWRAVTRRVLMDHL